MKFFNNNKNTKGDIFIKYISNIDGSDIFKTESENISDGYAYFEYTITFRNDKRFKLKCSETISKEFGISTRYYLYIDNICIKVKNLEIFFNRLSRMYKEYQNEISLYNL